MNKIAITFVVVLLSLSIIIRLDYSDFDKQTSFLEPKKEVNQNYAAENTEDNNNFMLSNITYIKDNTLSLKDNRLVSAIISQDVTQVRKLYQSNKTDIIYNYTYNNYTLKVPLIFLAIGKKNDDILDIILSNPKLDKDITTNLILYDRNGNALSTNITPLAYAVYTNKIPLIKKLIEHGADVNKKLIGNRTAMFYVNSKDALELLQNNADINPLSTQGNTPLMHAVIRNNVIAAFEFIAKGIDQTKFIIPMLPHLLWQ